VPFVSQAQRRRFYILYRQGKISKAKLEEWEAATKKKLPERATRKKKRKR
jgi:hypothetical protein